MTVMAWVLRIGAVLPARAGSSDATDVGQTPTAPV